MEIEMKNLTTTERNTKEYYLKRLIIERFNITESEALNIIENNPNLVYLDIENFDTSINIMHEKYKLQDDQLKQIFFNAPLLFFNSEFLTAREQQFAEHLGVTPHQFGVVLINNPYIALCDDDKFQSFMVDTPTKAGLSPKLMKYITMNAAGFQFSEEQIYGLVPRIKILQSLGATTAEILDNVSIFKNKMSRFLNKVKLSQLEQVPISRFIKSSYKLSEQKIFAKREAQRNGIINISDFYMPEKKFTETTSLRIEDLIKQFPLDESAQLRLDEEYALKFPHSHNIINKILAQYEKEKDERALNNPTTQQSNPENFTTIPINEITDYSQKIEILKIFGLTPPENADFYNHHMVNFILKLKIAKLSNLDLNIFSERHYKHSVKKILPRFMAKLNNVVNYDIYSSEKNFAINTSFSSEQLAKTYPPNDENQGKVHLLFAQQYPDLHNALNDLLKSNTSTNAVVESSEETAETLGAEPIDNNEKRYLRIMNIDKFALNVITHEFGLEKFSDEQLNHIALNFVTLKEFGFSTTEIVAKPKCLKLDNDKLTIRLKLSRINGRSNTQFLTKDFRCAEDTIYARTCGTKIMKLTANEYVYDTDANFTKHFGASTEELKKYCRLDENGLRLIDKLYSKTKQSQSGDENAE